MVKHFGYGSSDRYHGSRGRPAAIASMPIEYNKKGNRPMATTYIWIGPAGIAASGTIAADWSPSGGPPGPGAAEIIAASGTVLEGDGLLRSNTVILDGDRMTFTGDSLVTSGNPSIDAASLITTTTVPNSLSASTIDALGNFVNQGTILADGAAGSSLTINVGTTVINGTTVVGYSYNPGVLQSDAGNTLTIAIGASSELFNTGSIIADGGTVKITVSPSAIAGGIAPARGLVEIEGGGTLETAAAYSSGVTGTTQVFDFVDSTAGNTLKIDNIGSFSGRISGFSTNDTIDLGTSLAVGKVVYSSATDVLNLENNGGTILASLLIASGAFASGTFALNAGTADGFTIGSIVANGTTDTALTTTLMTPTASGTSGTWQATGSWLNGLVPGTVDTPQIGLGTSTNFTLTTGGSPVSVTGFDILGAQASVRITSNVTAIPNGVADRLGSLEVTAGNTLTSASLAVTEPGSAITIDAGAVVNLTGHQNTNNASVAGTLSVNPGDNYANTFSSGTVVVNGTLLAGHAPPGGGGGGTTLGYDSNTSANVTVNAGATVTDTRDLLGSDPTSAGTLTLNGAGAGWTDAIDVTDTAHATGYINVGYNDLSSNTPANVASPGPAATAQLLIENGATLTDQESGNIGDTLNSAGNVTVTAGGFWNLANNGIGCANVGLAGSGTLSVLNGGSVAIGNVGTFFNNGTTFTEGGIGIGISLGATGTVTVSGAGSQLSSQDGMTVGRFGQASVNILNGGTVTITGAGINVGASAAAGSSGTITIGGSGAAAVLNFGSLASGFGVGGGSQGTVTVSSNGTISMVGTGGIGVGVSASATGLMVVNGSGALINQGAASTGIGIADGASSTGTVVVENGGTISLNGTSSSAGVGVGQAAGARGTLDIESGGTFLLNAFTGMGVANVAGGTGLVIVNGSGAVFNEGTAASGIGIGNSGQGTLEVENGGSFLARVGGIGIGNNAGSTGTVTVSGSGSSITTLGTNGGIGVGNSGAGVLTISGSGTVSASSGVFIGTQTGGTGTVSVSGAGSKLAASGNIQVGGSGSGSLTIGSGGIVALGGASGSGSLGIGTGGTVTIAAGGELEGFGQVQDPAGLSNAGTILASGGTLNLNVGAGTMAIAPGATLALGTPLPSSAVVTFSGTGALSLGAPLLDTGTINGFGSGDTLILAGITNATSVTLGANNVLTVNQTTGPGVTLQLSPSQSFTGDTFSASVSGNATDITVGIPVNLASLTAAYTAIFQNAPTSTTLIPSTLTAIQNGQTTLAQWEASLIAQPTVQQTTLPALIVYDAFYGTTEGSGGLNYVTNQNAGVVAGIFTASGNPNVEEAVYSTLGSWFSVGGNNFATLYGGLSDTAYIDAVYQNIFGIQPSSGALTYLQGSLTGYVNSVAAAGIPNPGLLGRGAVYGDLLYDAEAAQTGAFYAPANAFLTAAANGTVTYNVPLSTEFPTGSLTEVSAMSAASADPDVIAITSSHQLVDPGSGGHTIQFLAGSSDDTLTLHTGGVDQISGFDPTDVLDLTALLNAAAATWNGSFATLGNYVTVADQGRDALVNFDPTGHGGGSTVAVLQGLGSVVTNLNELVARGAIRTT